MKQQLLVVAVPLLISGCASTLPEVITRTDNPDAFAGVAPVPYQNPAGAYTRRMPVDPKPWRGLNDAQRPKDGE